MTPPRPSSPKTPAAAPTGSAGSLPAPSDSASPSFEDGLARLTAIVDALEAGALPLEEAILRFEEGAALYKHCLARLDDARRRIEVLVSAAENAASGSEPGTVPFEDEDEPRS